MLKVKVFHIFLFIPILALAVTANVYVSHDGHKFAVELKPQKDRIMIGEPIYMDFELTNLSNVDLVMMFGGDTRNEYSRPDGFNVKVLNANGQILARPKLATLGGLVLLAKCPVRDSYRYRLYLPHWANIDKTGGYEISIGRDLVIKRSADKSDNVSSFLR
ncbi:MAG: hypothetical protein KF685_12675, partial [Acidobacteria bacterium]|nr:hypothetical protein [Acidobacteriota bacterium]